MCNIHFSRQIKKARLKLARLLKNKATPDALVPLLLRVVAIAGPLLLAECGQLSDIQMIDQIPGQSADEISFEPSHHDIDG